MSTSTEGKLHIDKASQELLKEAVDTFPVNPAYLTVTINTQGMPDCLKFHDEQKFLNECLTRRVIPHSEVVYRFERGLFLPYQFRVWKPECNLDNSTSSELQKAIALYQPHKKIFKAGPYDAQAFDVFRGLLHSLISNGDKIGEGELTSSFVHLTEYNEGDYFSTGLSFDDSEIAFGSGGLELKVESDTLEQEDREKLVSWFEKLRSKYNPVK